MILQNKNILLISPEPWDHIFVSKHHYAVHLGRRDNKVFFLNPPGKSQGATKTECKNVQSVHYTGFPKGLRYYPRTIQRHFIRMKFHELERLCGASFDIVWSFDNSVFFDFSALPPPVLKISHIVDMNQDFQTARAAATADLCLGVSRSIVHRQLQYNARSYFINHGYAMPVSRGDFSTLSRQVRARVGYAGNLDLRYIDWPTLQQVISGHSDTEFYFAGPYDDSSHGVQWLKERANVTLLGRLPKDTLAAFYAQMDILLLCYRSDHFQEQLENSHKMMEYLGSGKIVVATAMVEYEDLKRRELLLMTDTNEHYAELFKRALDNLQFWNEPERSNTRQRIALDNTYERQLIRIEELIDPNQDRETQ